MGIFSESGKRLSSISQLETKFSQVFRVFRVNLPLGIFIHKIVKKILITHGGMIRFIFIIKWL